MQVRVQVGVREGTGPSEGPASLSWPGLWTGGKLRGTPGDTVTRTVLTVAAQLAGFVQIHTCPFFMKYL